MRAWLRATVGTPSPAMVMAFAALMVALGGTAAAATATIVNIADPTTPTNVARVDATGALRTAGSSIVSGYVGPTAPRTPFFGAVQVLRGQNTLIAANTSTVALTRLSFNNTYDQINGAAIQVNLSQLGGSATTCDGSTGIRTIGDYDVQAGQTLSDAIGSPIVLKPFAAGHVWCLTANMFIQGNISTYFSPIVAWSGYVVAGTLPAGSASSARARAAVPRLHH